MSVLFETSLGDIVVDLEVTLCPTLSLNFLKLCKTYYYNFCVFFNVQKSFIAQTGDTTGTGNSSQSIFSLLPPSSKHYQPFPHFPPELHPTKLKHDNVGTLSMAVAQGGVGSQFFFTLASAADASSGGGEGMEYLDGRHAPFGRVVEGLDTLAAINDALLDQEGRPLRDIRIRHVIVLDDPFPDPEGLVVPENSPVPTPAILKSLRVGEEEDLDAQNPEELAKENAARDARAQALTLEMVGDLPFADVKPPENVLFVCKLNPATRSDDLELIFSRFGKITSCEVIKDVKTGDSLQYAFIEFEEQESAEKAYEKMDNVLIDDRRIHIDFSQSVSKLHNSWVFNRTGGRPPPSKRPHRDVSPPRRRDDGYDMVFDVGDSYGREKKGRKNDAGRDSDRRRRRSRSRSPPRKREDRQRNRDPERDGRRDRGGERDGYRDRDRDRGERGGREKDRRR
ncbi:cyclophilin-like protein [Atractiella rhizophila]|nr:cyclophilin-like protein [Atractiella rhizophila]